MRNDLPQCDFKDCRRCIDGNCNSKEAFRYCIYQGMAASKDVTLVQQEDNGDGTYHCVFKVVTPDGYIVHIYAPECRIE